MKVAVFGLGYVGAVTAACLANNGHEVWGVDPDAMKVGMIAEGRCPVIEPGLDDLVSTAVAQTRLCATGDPFEALSEAEISLVCVGTPSTPNGKTDLSFLLRAIKEIGQGIATSRPSTSGFHSIVVRSTVPPGTVEEAVVPALEAEIGRPLGEGFGVAMCPEFLREGSGVGDFYDPPFTVVGTVEPRVVSAMERLFGFLNRPVREVPVRTAEGLKYACNAYHALKVSFTNELSRLYRTLGVDSRSVMEVFCEDDRLNISRTYLRPGFAFGGSCLPKDLRSLLYLGRMNSIDMPVMLGTATSNELAITDIVDRAVRSAGRTVAILGLSFKVETDDLRESPNVRLAETLLGKGFSLRIYDPVLQPSRLIGTNLEYVDSKLPHLRRLMANTPDEALADADVAVVSFASDGVIEALRQNAPRLILDLNGRLGREVEAMPGYEGAGW